MPGLCEAESKQTFRDHLRALLSLFWLAHGHSGEHRQSVPPKAGAATQRMVAAWPWTKGALEMRPRTAARLEPTKRSGKHHLSQTGATAALPLRLQSVANFRCLHN